MTDSNFDIACRNVNLSYVLLQLMVRYGCKDIIDLLLNHADSIKVNYAEFVKMDSVD